MASFFASSKIIVFVTFTLYALTGNAITASTVFVTVSLYGTIKLTLTLFFPLAVERLSETAVSVRRITVRLLPSAPLRRSHNRFRGSGLAFRPRGHLCGAGAHRGGCSFRQTRRRLFSVTAARWRRSPGGSSSEGALSLNLSRLAELSAAGRS